MEKGIAPNEIHKAFFDEVGAVLQKYAAKLDGKEILAITSNIVGKVIAMQDQRTMTKEIIMRIVSTNIEAGNQEMVESLLDTKGTA